MIRGLFPFARKVLKMSVKTQGSQLYILDEEASGGAEVLVVECAVSISGLSNPREQIEVTCLESDTREYVGGLSTPGSVTVTVNFDPDNESHYRLYELWRNNADNFTAAIGYGTPVNVAPTIVAGEFTYPTTRTFIEFDAYVSDVPLEAALNSVWTSAITFQISGPYTIFRKTA